VWILVQSNEDKSRIKYLCSYSYDAIINYIHSFSRIKKYSDYKYTSSDRIYFDIRLGEEIKEVL
jgi:hypothetical protein